MPGRREPLAEASATTVASGGIGRASAMDRLASAGGSVLAAATQTLGSLRPAAKPLHPSGEIYTGRVRRRGATSATLTGVEWIDHPGLDEVEVRRSRAIGLPETLPDIHGLALRIRGSAGPADLLFAGTGTGRLTRFLLVAGRDPRRPLTTLLPYRTGTGPLLLRADGIDPDGYELSWARPRGAWHPFATLQLIESRGDPLVSFDPLLHRLPGLDHYPTVRHLREPAYARARRTRATDR